MECDCTTESGRFPGVHLGHIMIIIDSSNIIHLNDGKGGAEHRNTGYRVTQRAGGTVVYSVAPNGDHYCEHGMPHARYSTSHDKPASGVPGRAQFEADIRALIETIDPEGNPWKTNE